jgi:fused signal recognition particle receptor
MDLATPWQSLKEKTSQLFAELRNTDDGSKVAYTDWVETLEEALFRADVDPSTVDAILERLDAQFTSLADSDIGTRLNALKTLLLGLFDGINTPPSEDALLAHDVLVLMLSGVNGSGKTTTIAKLAHHYKALGQRVFIIGADTYRAAADAQLATWCKRLDVPYFNQASLDGAKASPASVVSAGLQQALTTRTNNDSMVILIDTSGRLQVNTPLMEELGKVKRSIHKVLEQHEASHTVASLLVLDATTGQNALKQVEQFNEHVGIDALVCTKLDASARAGMLLSIADRYKRQPLYLSAGESLDTLSPFDPHRYVSSLLPTSSLSNT